jgi:hypothetical protein
MAEQNPVFVPADGTAFPDPATGNQHTGVPNDFKSNLNVIVGAGNLDAPVKK